MIKNLNNIDLNLFFNKKIFMKLFFSILLSSLIFLLSLDEQLWPNFWGSLQVPPNIIPFSDFKAHLFFYQCTEIGIDINNQNCIYINDGNAKINTHPRIWVYLFGLFNLDNPIVYNFSILFILSLYFYIIFQLFEKFNNSSSKILLLALLLSTSNFLLLERLGTDIIIFILVYFTLNIRAKLAQSLIIFFGFILKYYPIFLVSLFIDKKKFLFIFLAFVISFFYFYYLNEMNSLNKNMVEMALPIAYGSRTMLKAFYHLSVHYNLFLNESNIDFYRNLVVLFFSIYVFILILFGYFGLNKEIVEKKYEKFFLAGASIYVGSFIVGANVDYRLIFLVFTIPYILNLKSKNIKYLLVFTYIVSFNSFLFMSEPFLDTVFFIKAFFIFSCKFIILSLLSFLIGFEMNKIKFFKI